MTLFSEFRFYPIDKIAATYLRRARDYANHKAPEDTNNPAFVIAHNVTFA